MEIRPLEQHEIGLVWGIDRREVIERVYHFREGNLTLEEEHYDMRGWPAGEAEHYQPLLDACFDRGGTFLGVFEGSQLIAVMVLESQFIGRKRDRLQLKFLHVSCNQRGKGIGTKLFERAVADARALGARGLYISATPAENTVHFYRSRGCVLATELDPELFALEPEDIHLEYVIP